MVSSSSEAPAGRKRVFWPALAVGLPLFGLLVWRFDFLCDDAYISFRYSRNVARGLGFRYNLGVEPPVEGYSNFLWVLYLALFERFEASLALASRVTSAGCGAVLLVATVRFADQRLQLDRVGALCVALFLALLPPLALWSTGGLATMPAALFVFLAFARLFGAKPHPLSAGALALTAALLRTDGVLWGLSLLGLYSLGALLFPGSLHAGEVASGAERGVWRRLRPALVAGAVLGGGVGLHLLWRRWYHGDWVPNTAHAKVGLSQATLLRGAQYVGSFLATFPGLVLALVLAAGWGLRRDRVLVLTAMGLVAAVFGYSALVGGDYMAMGRFLVPALPYFGLLFAAGLAGLARGGVERAGATPPTSGSSIGRPAWRLALTVLACGGSLLPAYGHDLVPAGLAQRLHFRWDRAEPASELEEWRGLVRGADYGVRIGRLLARHTRPGESIVLGALGGQGYYSDLFVYDRYGLVTREVALLPEQTDKRRSAGHSKYVTVDFFLPKRPTYLGAMVARRGRDPQLHPSLAGKVEFLRFPALPADGFPEGTRLILLRGVYGDAGPRDAGKIGSEDESRAGETQD